MYFTYSKSTQGTTSFRSSLQAQRKSHLFSLALKIRRIHARTHTQKKGKKKQKRKKRRKNEQTTRARERRILEKRRGGRKSNGGALEPRRARCEQTGGEKLSQNFFLSFFSSPLVSPYCEIHAPTSPLSFLCPLTGHKPFSTTRPRHFHRVTSARVRNSFRFTCYQNVTPFPTESDISTRVLEIALPTVK